MKFQKHVEESKELSDDEEDDCEEETKTGKAIKEEKNICCPPASTRCKRCEELAMKCAERKFKFIEYDKLNRKVSFICHCGNEVSASDSRLRLGGDHCAKCANSKNKISIETIIEAFKKRSFTVMKPEEYEGRRSRLTIQCDLAGHVMERSYADITRDGRLLFCHECKKGKK